MINLQNGSVPTPVDAIEIDKAVLDLQTRLSASLSWLSHGYGKTYRNIDVSQGLTVYFPEVFLGNNAYMRVTPDNDKQGQSLILVGNEEVLDNDLGQNSHLQYDVSIIFTANLKLINSTLLETEYYQQNLIRDVRHVLQSATLGAFYQITMDSIDRDFTDVWREFNIEEKRGISHAPFTHFRVNCTVTLKEDCVTAPFDRCATILNMTTQAEQDCLSSNLGGNCDYNDCSTLLANLTAVTKNTCILPTYDFTDTDVQSNVTTQQQTDLEAWLCDYNDCPTLLTELTDDTKNNCILPTYDFTTNDVKLSLTQQQIDDLVQWLCVGINAGTAGSGDFFKVGSHFYGLRADGGVDSVGLIYRTDFGVNANVLYDFSTSTMHTPLNFCYEENGIIYGIASAGGNNGVGGMFSYNVSTNTLTEIAHFDNPTTGNTAFATGFNYGYGKAVKKAGYIYIVTRNGSTNNTGAILAIDVVNSSPIIVYPFGAGIVNTGLQTFVSASDGLVYEFTNKELRSIDSSTNTSSLVATTQNIATSAEFGQPIVELNGVLYWTIRTAALGNTAIYQYDLNTQAFSQLGTDSRIPLDLFVWNNGLYLITLNGGIYSVDTTTGATTAYIGFTNQIRGQGAIDGNLLYYRDIISDRYFIIDMQARTVTNKALNFI